jgi:hypothetical protein
MQKLTHFIKGRRWPGSRRSRAIVAGIVAVALIATGTVVAFAVPIPPLNSGGLAGGTLVASNVIGPPANFLVTSAVGGSVSLPVQVTGAAFDPLPVQAFAGEDQDALQGNVVTLDGSGSTGPITSFAWTQTAGPAVTLNGATTATPTFTAPAARPRWSSS